MTVCIAAFAAKSKAIVLISDKALTYGAYGPTPMQSDTGVRKLLHLGQSGWEVLFAGDGAFAEKVVYQAGLALKDRPTIAEACQEVMECVRDAYQTVRERLVIDTILRPRLLDKDLLFKRNINELHPLDEGVFKTLWSELGKFDAGCTLLVCGFDREGPHIFMVSDPGTIDSCDLHGFCAIGIGDQAATSRLLWQEIDRNDPLPNVIYEVFHAKVQAEIIQGVGYTWDANVIVRGKKLIPVRWSVIRAIEKIFEVADTSPFDKARLPKEATRKQWRTTVEDFAKHALQMKARTSRPAKVVALRTAPPKSA